MLKILSGYDKGDMSLIHASLDVDVISFFVQKMHGNTPSVFILFMLDMSSLRGDGNLHTKKIFPLCATYYYCYILERHYSFHYCRLHTCITIIIFLIITYYHTRWRPSKGATCRLHDFQYHERGRGVLPP